MFRFSIILFVCGLLSFGSGNFAFAVPVIEAASSLVRDNGSATLTGSGFGVKNIAEPIRFDDFEGLVVGNDIATETCWWSIVSPTSISVPEISANFQRSSNSTRNLMCNVVDRNPIAYRNNIGFADTGKAFVSLWLRWDWGDMIYSDKYQIKVFRLPVKTAGNGSVTYPDISNFNWWWDKEGGFGSHQYVNHYTKGNGSNTKYFSRNTYQQDKWHHIIVEVDMGSAGNANGTWTIYSSKADFAGAYVTTGASDVQVIDSVGDLINGIKLDNYVDDATAKRLTLYYDDIYIDNIWARVEIGDAATYESCTHREIQIPTSWSSDTVSISVNTGSFGAGDTAYFFIVDADGNPSAGYPVTIETSTLPPLSASIDVLRVLAGDSSPPVTEQSDIDGDGKLAMPDAIKLLSR